MTLQCGHEQPCNLGAICQACLEAHKADCFELSARLQRALESAKRLRQRLQVKRARRNDNAYARKQGFQSMQELQDSGWKPWASARWASKRHSTPCQGDLDKGLNATPHFAKQHENPFTRHEVPCFS